MVGKIAVVKCDCGRIHTVTEYELMSLGVVEHSRFVNVTDYSPTPQIKCLCGRKFSVTIEVSLRIEH